MKKIRTLIVCLLCVAVFLGVAFYPVKRSVTAERKIIRIWNVDTFEGGKGSRVAFLKECARRVEHDANCFYLVTGYTKEGALEARQRGEMPDILSFGIGLDAYLDVSLPLSQVFSGGEIDGQGYAVPWCRGGYFLFSTSDFSKEGECAISCGGDNLPQVVSSLFGISGECVPSLSAYVRFLNGEFKYLLGTQRDACRFQARGVSVNVKPLSEYNDLYQYCSVLSQENKAECDKFIEALRSEEMQARLSSIGMYPIESEEAHYTVSVFLSSDAREELLSLAQVEHREKMLAKFLKKI